MAIVKICRLSKVFEVSFRVHHGASGNILRVFERSSSAGIEGGLFENVWDILQGLGGVCVESLFLAPDLTRPYCKGLFRFVKRGTTIVRDLCDTMDN